MDRNCRWRPARTAVLFWLGRPKKERKKLGFKEALVYPLVKR